METKIHWFEANNATAVVLLCSAVGIAQRHYARFAEWLAEQGLSVVTWDYPGVAEDQANRHLDCGVQAIIAHFEVLIEAIVAKHPNKPLYFVGHSMGGNYAFITPKMHHFRAAVTVGTQVAYYKDWSPAVKRWQTYFQWHVLVPALTKLFGFFPGKYLGIGLENLPATFVRDWHDRRRYPDFNDHLATFGMRSYQRAFEGKVLAITSTDDHICTAAAHDRLYGTFRQGQVQRLTLNPEDFGHKAIGHFGFFRSKFKDSLWPIIGEFLKKQN